LKIQANEIPKPAKRNDFVEDIIENRLRTRERVFKLFLKQFLNLKYKMYNFKSVQLDSIPIITILEKKERYEFKDFLKILIY